MRLHVRRAVVVHTTWFALAHVTMYIADVRFSEHYERFRSELPDRERITLGMCERAVRDPIERSEQSDGRVLFWGYVAEEDKYLKVIVEPGMEEIVTAHFDRGFKRKMERRQR